MSDWPGISVIDARPPLRVLPEEHAMTDYHLIISNWLYHHWGRVEGPHVESCHGTDRWDELRHVCAEGHQLPRRVDWSVEEPWGEARLERYRDRGFEGDGPNQFITRKRLIEVAVLRFTGRAPRRKWEGEVVTGSPGDRLILGGRLHGPENINPDYRPAPDCPPWGSVLAEIPPEKKSETGDAAPKRS